MTTWTPPEQMFPNDWARQEAYRVMIAYAKGYTFDTPEKNEKRQRSFVGKVGLREGIAAALHAAAQRAYEKAARAERERLQWSRDLPTEHDEWYFVRVPGTDRTECVFVTVDNEYPDHLIAGGYAMSDAHPDPRLGRAYADCEWAGPLTPPREEPRT